MTNLSDIITEAVYLPTYVPLVQKRSVFMRGWGEVEKKLKVRGDDGAEWGTKEREKLRVGERQEHTYFRLGIGRYSGSKNYPSTLYSSFLSFFFALRKPTSEVLLATSCTTLCLVYMLLRGTPLRKSIFFTKIVF